MEQVLDPRKISNPALRDLAIAAAQVAKLEETAAEFERTSCEWSTDDREPIPDYMLAAQEVEEEDGGDEADQADDDDDEVEDDAYPTMLPEEYWMESPADVAVMCINDRWQAEKEALESRASAWLAEDPSHWPLLREVVFDPWKTNEGRGPLRWIVQLGSLQAVAPYATPYTLIPLEANARISTWLREDEDGPGG